MSSLALSLSQPSNQEPVTQSLLMSALFDTGQFHAIRMTGMDGALLFDRQQTLARVPQQVPAWFQTLVPVPRAQAQRAVSNGWQQLGLVQVTVDNRMAQTALWQSSLRLGMLIMLAGLAWGIFVGALLGWFRRVLNQEIAQQVQRIGTMTDASQDGPHTAVAELEGVSSAIHDAQARVRDTEQAQRQRIESLLLETHSDAVTGLPNRKYFLNELNKALQSPDRAQGHVLMVRQRDLLAMNQSMARAQVDAWLQGVTQQVQALLQRSYAGQAQLARLNGSDFALLLPGEQGPAAMQLIQQVRSLLNTINVALADGNWSRWAFVVTPYMARDTATTVLSRLDQGLMQAESAGHGDVEYAEIHGPHSEKVLDGEGNWREFLTTALQAPQRLGLAITPMRSASLQATLLWQEASLELYGAQGEVWDAAMFLPAALRLGLSEEYDLQAITLALQRLQTDAQQPLVVRVSMRSLESAHFVQRVQALLRDAQWQPVLPALVLELDAFTLELLPQATLELGAAAAALGAGIGLRRLDAAPKALLHLPSLPLRYAKLGGYFAGQAMAHVGSQHLLQAMIATVQAQGARLHVVDAVDVKTSEWLLSKGVSLCRVER